MSSYFSNCGCDGKAVGERSAAVSVINAGRGIPLLFTITAVTLPISVLVPVTPNKVVVPNSITVPDTETPSPTATVGALEVNTKMPSEVFGSASLVASGSCKKNPLDFNSVTTPVVETKLPFSGEVEPLP